MRKTIQNRLDEITEHGVPYINTQLEGFPMRSRRGKLHRRFECGSVEIACEEIENHFANLPPSFAEALSSACGSAIQPEGFVKEDEIDQSAIEEHYLFDRSTLTVHYFVLPKLSQVLELL
ncbi:MAG: hypothetical protein QF486_03545 [Candidatus Woesearchaeota archaeon]|nr:hypothetical protein [Candidatus Woesearchaeota archaeon]MDP7198670.1 hypothetical protein [Candidatus Woesearchaeota archaeon]MDP7467644.1 hypothetical protein [Candidatus Woesearchaeota archaeon]MDP7647138.1 hypothetical protein [Candidatus Woesearchaeota archaeon]